MNILEAIRERWNASAALTALVPSTSLATGTRTTEDANDDGDYGDDLPSAVVEIVGGDLQYTNSDSTVTDDVDVRIYASSQSQALAIRSEFNNSFSHAKWTTTGLTTNVDVILSKVTDQEITQDRNPSVWKLSIQLEIKYQGV